MRKTLVAGALLFVLSMLILVYVGDLLALVLR